MYFIEEIHQKLKAKYTYQEIVAAHILLLFGMVVTEAWSYNLYVAMGVVTIGALGRALYYYYKTKVFQTLPTIALVLGGVLGIAYVVPVTMFLKWVGM